MKQPGTSRQQPFESAGPLHTPLVPRLPKHIRLLVDAACAALGGAGHMSLADWHDVEQQLKRKLENAK